MVYIYKEYNFSDFKNFVKEHVGNDAIKFIEENDLWEVIFDSYNNNSRYHEKDRIIDEINTTIFIMKRVCR